MVVKWKQKMQTLNYKANCNNEYPSCENCPDGLYYYPSGPARPILST